MLSDIKTIVFKVGTSTLTYENGKLNLKLIFALSRVLSDLKNSGIDVILVTSGAIGAGFGKLGITDFPHDIPARQAAAAVGQNELMFIYDKFFGDFGHTIGQVLITKEDFEKEDRREHLLNNFKALLQFNVLPIVNENDAVATDEIVFGDNDTLSAQVAKLIDADMLIMLTDIDGLYDKNPKECDAHLISFVDEITPEMVDNAKGSASKLGTGGMTTKIMAAKIAKDNNIATVILKGEHPDNIYKILDGERIGTYFAPRKKDNE
ncbi:MAG: glutamate 5-kinase [Clostridia bacterium]|nr:glutamate 5-kinase [Clostridia bacterium]